MLRIARETGWGYSRIHGKIQKFHVGRIGRSTIHDLLKKEGYEPAPSRTQPTWDEFIARYAKTLWACDFMSIRSWTMRGRLDLYLLVFIHVQSRRVWISDATEHPDTEWVIQQARNFCMYIEEHDLKATLLLHDRDAKFTAGFDRIIKAQGIIPKRLPIRSPNLNAYAERFVQTLKHECLHHFLICGGRHLDYLVQEFVEHYHTKRPHQGIGSRLIVEPPGDPPDTGEIVCEERLGGLLKHYYRQVA